MVDRLIVVRRTVVDPLLEGEQVDEEIKSVLVEQLVKEKILSQLLLSNLSDAAIQRMAGRVKDEDKETFKLYMVTLVDQAKAMQAAKRKRVDTEQEKEDIQRFRQNIISRFGPDVEVPPTLVPPYRILSKLSRSPFEHMPASEFLVSAASTDKSGVQQVEDLNTGKAVSVRTDTALLQLAEKRSVQAAVVFDHKYRSALPGYHQEGKSISDVLEKDLDPSLYLMAQFGGLEDFDSVFEQDDQNRHGKKREERPICAYYQRGQCTRGSRCPFRHVDVRDAKKPRSFYDLPHRPVSAPVVSEDKAVKTLNAQVCSDRAFFHSGAGLRAPLPWDPSKPPSSLGCDTIEKRLFVILKEASHSASLDKVLDRCIAENFPPDQEITLQSALDLACSKALPRIAVVLGVSDARAKCGSPLRPGIISALLRLCGADCFAEADILASEIDRGCGLGSNASIPHSALWPNAKRHHKGPFDLVEENYSSAINNEAFLREILDEEVKAGRMVRLGKASEFHGKVTPVALIPKASCPTDPSEQRPKHFRVVEDYRRSFVNSGVELSQTLSLPRFSDVQLLLRWWLKEANLRKIHGSAFVLDLKSAFRYVGISPLEVENLNIKCGSTIYQHRRLAFGHRASPFVFSRIAGAIERTILYLLRSWSCAEELGPLSTLLYVDDLYCLGDESSLLTAMSLVSLIWKLAGFDLAYDKLSFGPVQKFLGMMVSLELRDQGASISVPLDKVKSLTKTIHQVLSKGRVSLKKCSSLSGQLIWVLQCFPALKAYLASSYRAISLMNKKSLKSIRIPERLREDLIFLEHFLRCVPVNFVVIENEPSSGSDCCVVGCDASLTALAGFWHYPNSLWTYWTCPLSKLSPKVKGLLFQGRTPSSADMCALELFTALTTLYLAFSHRPGPEQSRIVLQCDNEGAVKILQKMYSQSPSLQSILKRSCSFMPILLPYFSVYHITTQENVLADALSRDVSSPPVEWSRAAADFSWCDSSLFQASRVTKENATGQPQY